MCWCFADLLKLVYNQTTLKKIYFLNKNVVVLHVYNKEPFPRLLFNLVLTTSFFKGDFSNTFNQHGFISQTPADTNDNVI